MDNPANAPNLYPVKTPYDVTAAYVDPIGNRINKPKKTDQPSTHGGKREGAGRPAVYDDLQDFHVYLDAASAKIVDARMDTYGESFSLALRTIIAAYEAARADRSLRH